jgi:hypothetical protein
MKSIINKILYIIFCIMVIWCVITSIIQRFENSKLTETELFMKIPKSFILDFKDN